MADTLIIKMSVQPKGPEPSDSSSECTPAVVKPATSRGKEPCTVTRQFAMTFIYMLLLVNTSEQFTWQSGENVHGNSPLLLQYRLFNLKLAPVLFGLARMQGPWSFVHSVHLQASFSVLVNLCYQGVGAKLL